MSQPDGPIDAAPVATDRSPLHRWIAMLEVLAVCGIPTQLAIAAVLLLGFGMTATDEGGLSLAFFATVSFIDTALIALLIRVFLAMGGENPSDVFVGARPVGGEILRGLLLVPVVFLLVAGLVLTLRSVAPWMHTVQRNPMEAFLGTPAHTAVFLLVVVLAGGIREELQRAFILHRFDRHLGGATLGLVVFSLTFGLLHLNQGIDVAVAIGLLGLAWGMIYLKRRSAVLPMANHAAFNAIQVVQIVAARSLGW